MNQKYNLEELERKVDNLRKEAHELKIIIQSIKRESVNQAENKHPIESFPEETKVEMPIKQKTVKSPKQPVDWEKQIGQVWLPRVFIFVLLLGVIWAFKAASDYGFINNPVKIILGYAAAGLFLYLGFLQLKYKRNALGQVLLGGSIVLLLIVTFSMHVLYGMMPLIPTFILNIIWVSLGIYLSNRLKSQPLAILTGIGGYLIPFLLESETPSVINFVMFETFLYLALLVFAMRKQFNILYHVSFGLLHITLLVGAFLLSNGDIKVFASAALVQHLFLLLTLFINHIFVKQQIGILLTSFLLTIAWVEASFSTIQFESIVLIGFGLYLFLSIYLWNKGKERLSATLSITSLALVVYLLSHFDVENVLGLLIIQGLLSLYLGMIAKSIVKQVLGLIIYFYSAMATFAASFDGILSIDFLNWLILLASMYVLNLLIPLFKSIKKDERDKVKTIIHVITMILLLVFITKTVDVITQESSLNIQFMSVSIAWAIYALLSIFIGSAKNSKMLRVFGLILLFVTLAKLLFIDLNFISIFIRAVLFIGLGIIGILGSRIFYKNSQK